MCLFSIPKTSFENLFASIQDHQHLTNSIHKSISIINIKYNLMQVQKVQNRDVEEEYFKESKIIFVVGK